MITERCQALAAFWLSSLKQETHIAFEVQWVKAWFVALHCLTLAVDQKLCDMQHRHSEQS